MAGSWLSFEKVERRDEVRGVVAGAAVDAGDAFRFVGDGQMAGVAIGIGRHYFVLDAGIDESVYLRRGLEEPEAFPEREAFAAFGFRGVLQFAGYPEGGDELVLPEGEVPPFAGPFAAGLHLNGGPGFKVEARDAGLDVDEAVHGWSITGGAGGGAVGLDGVGWRFSGRGARFFLPRRAGNGRARGKPWDDEITVGRLCRTEG